MVEEEDEKLLIFFLVDSINGIFLEKSPEIISFELQIFHQRYLSSGHLPLISHINQPFFIVVLQHLFGSYHM